MDGDGSTVLARQALPKRRKKCTQNAARRFLVCNTLALLVDAGKERPSVCTYIQQGHSRALHEEFDHVHTSVLAWK